MYKKRNAIAKAGKTRPTKGTKIWGRKEATIFQFPYEYQLPC
jgi:hypothetical protein